MRADVYGDPNGVPVVLLHGGGQTRHSWAGTAAGLAQDGWQVVSVDQRGHGDSAWDPGGSYSFRDYAADVSEIVPQLAQAPILVGASLGGIAALCAEGTTEGTFSRALVLVDVATRLEAKGTERIIAFMTAHPDGFASLEECADAVAEYNHHRRRPKNPEGLAKNLRQGEDGRWRWHWDPAFLGIDRGSVLDEPEMLDAAARAVDVPTLLVRGRQSDILSEEGVEHFLGLVPHARYADVSEAGHMVAGDNNDRFTGAVRDFLNTELRDE